MVIGINVFYGDVFFLFLTKLILGGLVAQLAF